MKQGGIYKVSKQASKLSSCEQKSKIKTAPCAIPFSCLIVVWLFLLRSAAPGGLAAVDTHDSDTILPSNRREV